MSTWVYILIRLVVLVFIGVLLKYISNKTNKINIVFRYFFILPFSLFFTIYAEALIRIISSFLSLFWGEDTNFNIAFISYTLLPFISSYSFINAACFMAPKYKVYIAFVLGIILSLLNIYIFYMYLFNNKFGFSDGLLNNFELSLGRLENTIYFFFVLLGVVVSIKHAKNEMSFIGLD